MARRASDQSRRARLSQRRADVLEAGSIGSPSNRNERPSNAKTANTTNRNRDVKSLRYARSSDRSRKKKQRLTEANRRLPVSSKP
jgi:hypothetical protein